MFTINLKGKSNPKDKNLVKLEMVLFKTGYTRVTKVLSITGKLKEWDNKSQCFKSKTGESFLKNKSLSDLRLQYQNVAEEWENEGRNWSPVEWTRYFDEEALKQEECKVITVLQMIDQLIDRFSNQQRFKNGKLVTSNSNAREYKFLKGSLTAFTKQKYGKAFSSYFFRDITEKFLIDYALYLQMRGAEKGNKGAVVGRLKKFYAVFNHAEKKEMPGVNTKLFRCVELKMKHGKFVPKTISHEIMLKIEKLDRCKFSILENLHLDLFLFSYYSGGMANVDVAHLKWNNIVNNQFEYERIKIAREAKMPVVDKAKAIIDKYKDKCFEDYVLPIFTQKHISEQQQHDRVERLSYKVNKTLEKVRKLLKYPTKITWYSARGTFITRMLKEGYNTSDVGAFAGNTATTIDRHYYRPIFNEETRKEINKII
ncbi:tyrosine-type recombinase/integrase [Dysgonomonas sp. GY617]|uniref:tyrosine-type recombinase/integrase n=1 Tax=Dysgonomonas sp. GY617 TaxID=2780420 RepID=UPI0018845998|nr:tyrosine-type recombinase/integrase [Dysgonomonas sp. GY617]MBF0575494.1 phage integrase SAM-like domain-containing protein [Dysgonomonas sp. GY617]